MHYRALSRQLGFAIVAVLCVTLLTPAIASATKSHTRTLPTDAATGRVGSSPMLSQQFLSAIAAPAAALNPNASHILVTSPHVANGIDAASITVQVIDDGGAPAVGATVWLKASGAGNVFVLNPGVTDASGYFTTTLTSTQPGSKIINALISDGVEWHWIPTSPQVEFTGASISGAVYLDVNRDGERNNDEGGISNVQLGLYISSHTKPVKSVLTDDDGNYSFTGLLAGTYRIAPAPLDQYGFGTDALTVTLGDFTTVTGQDFGVYTAARVDGYIFVDANQDAQRQQDEVGLSDVLVNALDAQGNLAASTTSEESGTYTLRPAAEIPVAPDNFVFNPAPFPLNEPTSAGIENGNLSSGLLPLGAAVYPVNYNFETGDLSGWTVSSTGAASVVSDTYSLDGSYLLLNANSVWAETAPFVVPVDTQSVRFDYFSWRPGGVADGRSVTVQALSGAEFEVLTVIGTVSGSAAEGWQVGVLDLQAYQGQQVKLRFTAAWDSRARIDNVTLNIETPGWTPSDARYVQVVSDTYNLEGAYLLLNANSVWAETAPFIVPVGAQSVRFDYFSWRPGGVTDGRSVTVRALSGVGFDISTDIGTVSGSAAEGWQEGVLDLQAYQGQQIKLRFTAAWDSRARIDNVALNNEASGWTPSDARYVRIATQEFPLDPGVSAPENTDFDHGLTVLAVDLHNHDFAAGLTPLDTTTYPTNYNFETGDLSGWTVSSASAVSVVSDTYNLDGAYLLLNANSVWAESTPFTVPVDAQSMRFDYFSWRPSDTTTARSIEVRVLSGAAFEVSTVIGTVSGSAADGWQKGVLDLQAYQGQQVKVRFTAAWDSRARIDNVTLNNEMLGWTPSDARYVRVMSDTYNLDGAYLLLNANSVWAESTPFTVPVDAQSVRFDYFSWRPSDTTTARSIEVRVLSGAAFEVSTVIGTVSGSAADGWQKGVLDLQAYQGQQVKVRFTAAWDSRARIDNVTLNIETPGWRSSDARYVRITDTDGYYGNYLLLDYAAASSTPFLVPTSIASLQFDYFIWREGYTGTAVPLYVDVLSGPDFSISTRSTLNSAYNDGWQPASLDITRFRGQVIELRFGAGYNAKAKVDNIALIDGTASWSPITLTHATPHLLLEGYVNSAVSAPFLIPTSATHLYLEHLNWRSDNANSNRALYVDVLSGSAFTTTTRIGTLSNAYNDGWQAVTLNVASFQDQKIKLRFSLEYAGNARIDNVYLLPHITTPYTITVINRPNYTPTTPDAVAVDAFGGAYFAIDFGSFAVDRYYSAVAVAPQTLVADGESMAAITVTLRDGNAAPLPGYLVGLDAPGIAVSVIQPAQPTNAAGQTVGYIAATYAPQTVVVTARAITDNVVLAQAAPVTFVPGLPDAVRSGIVAAPAAVVANDVDAAVFTVTLRDAFDNVVAGKEVRVNAQGTALSLTQHTTQTNVLGQVYGEVRSSVAQTVTLTGHDVTDNITLTQIAHVLFSSTDPALSTVDIVPAGAPVDAAVPPLVTITLRDRNGAPLPGKLVELRANNSALYLNGAPANGRIALGLSGANGVATATLTTTLAGTYTLTAYGDGIQLASQGGVTFTAGAVDAQKSLVWALPIAAPADGVAPATVYVNVYDAYHNPIPGATVVLDAIGNDVALTQHATQTNALGQITGDVRSAVVQTVVLTATANGVPLAATAQVNFLGANLRVTKTAPSTALTGERITYTLTLRNTGVLTAPNVVLTDTLPAAVRYLTHTAPFSATLAGQDVVWDAGTVLPGAEVRFALVAVVAEDALLYATQTNTAVVTTSAFEVDTTDNTAEAVTTVQPRRPELRLTPSYTALTLQRGTATTLILQMKNTGTGVISDALLTAPAHIPWITVSPEITHVLHPGESIPYTLTLAPPTDLPSGTYRDLVKATSANAGNRSAGIAVRVVGVTRTLALSVNDGYGPVGGAYVRLVQQAESYLVTEGISVTQRHTVQARTDAGGNVLLADLESGAYDYTITAAEHGAATGVLTITSGAGVQEAVVTLSNLPLLTLDPQYPEMVVRPGETGSVQTTVRNGGLMTATNVRIVTPEAVPWLYVGVLGNREALAAGEALSVTLFASPPPTLTAPALYRQYVDVLADNAPATRFALTVRVSEGTTGTLQLAITDNAGIPLEDAQVTLVSKEAIPVVTGNATRTYYENFVERTNAGGMVSFVGIPTGNYNYFVDAEGFEPVSVDPFVGPGQPYVGTVTLQPLPFSATWVVEETEIADVYDITVTLTYRTELLQVLPLYVQHCTDGTVTGVIEVRNPSTWPVADVQVEAQIPNASFAIHNNGQDIAGGEIAYFSFTASVEGAASGWIVANGAGDARGKAPARVSCGDDWQWRWDSGGAFGVCQGRTVSFPGLGTPRFDAGAGIQLKVNQEAVLERQAFLVDLTLANPDIAMTNLSVNIMAYDSAGESQPTHFTITPTTPTALPDLLPGGADVRQQWVIVPAYLDITAPTVYTFRATLSYLVEGVPYILQSLPVDVIVHPQPEVHLTYFVQRYARANEPALLGVLAENRGAGTARNLHIASAYPKLLGQWGKRIDFDLLGTLENGVLQAGDLQLDFGDLAAGEVVSGGWVLSFSEAGYFTDLQVTCQQRDYQGMTLSNLLYCDGAPQVADNALQHLCGDECPDLSAGDKQGFTGGPINTHNGNYSYQTTDLSLPTVGTALRLERSYNSQNVFSDTDTLGAGWTHAYAMRLEFPEPTGAPTLTLRTGDAALDRSALYYRDYLVVRLPGGSRLRLADNGDGTYTGYPGSQTSLTRQEVNGVVTYTLIAADQTARVFDATGRLQLIRDRRGNATQLTYAVDGRLIRVSDPTGGRWLELDYLTLPLEGAPTRLARVRDSAGRQVQYGYDDLGNLAVLTDTRGLAWTYVYTPATMGDVTAVPLLHAIFDPAGGLVERTAYDDAGRANYQEDSAGTVLTLTYQSYETLMATAGYTWVHRYDFFGALVEQVDTAGQSAARIYDQDFRPAQSTDVLGRSTQMAWVPGCGLPEIITDTLGQVTTLTYDGRSNPTEYVDAAQQRTRFVYDDANNLIAQTNALSQTTTYTYNAYGQLLSTTTAAGETTTYAYDAWGQRTVMTDAAGLVTRYGYDLAGRLITTTSSTGLVTVNVYDDGDNLLRVTRNYTTAGGQNYLGLYNQVTAYAYDPVGRRTHVTDTLGLVSRSWYNAAGQLVGSTRNYSPTLYPNHGPDNAWNFSTWYGYDALGRQTLVTDTLGHVTYTEYDGEGRVLRTTRNYLPGYPQNYHLPPLGGTEGGHYNLITEYGYDAVGNQILVTDTLGGVTYTEYDELNRVKRTWQNYLPDHPQNTYLPPVGGTAGGHYNLLTEYSYDAVGNQVWVTDTLGAVTYTAYDALNRPVTVTTNYVDGVFDPAYPDEDLLRVTLYDAAGRVSRTQDAGGRITVYEYDAQGRQIAVIQNYQDGSYDPARPDEDIKQMTVYDDATGRVTTRLQIADAVIPTWYAYDVLGRLVTTTNALSGTTVTEYDVLGRRAASIDAEGNTTRYGYDPAGRLVTTTNALSGTVVTVYDALGRRVAQTNPLGYTTVYTYDSAGRLVAQADPLGNVTTYGYDALGRRTVITDADGVAITTIYDAAGRAATTSDALGNTTAYEYDTLGRRTVVTDANGTATHYEYDDLGRLIVVVENYQTTQPPDYQTNVRTEYGYDTLGNLRVITDALGHTTVYTYDLAGRRVAEADALGNITTYVYDGHGRRTDVVYPDASGPLTVTTAYNPLGWATDVVYPGIGDVPGFTVSYSYNALGHREAVTDATGTMAYDYDALYRPLDVGALTGNVTYTYNAAGQRVNLIYPTSEVVTYTHDAAGRLTRVYDWNGGTTVYTYTAAGRLSGMARPNGVTSAYSYDTAGRLVEIEHRDAADLLLARYTYALDAVGNRVSVQEIVRQPENEVPHGPGDVVVTVLDTTGAPEVGLHVYAFAGTTYAGVNGTTDASGQVTLTLEEGDYRFRADKNGTQFWSGVENTCPVPGCVSDMVTTTIPAVVAVQDSVGTPEAGLKVYAFNGTTYAGYNKTTDAAGLVTFTLPVGDYRFRADKNGTQFWSGVENTCPVPGCVSDMVTTTIPAVVAVQDSVGTPEAGLMVYAFKGTTYAGYNKTTDAAGQVTFTLPMGNYRFRADKNGTQFWSGVENTCTLPGCASDTVTTTIPVVVTITDSDSTPEVGLKVYAFDGTTYSSYNKTTDAAGLVTFTLPFGDYRFRADKAGTQYWSGAANHCTVPGCNAATITTTLHTVVTVQDSSGNPEAGLRVYAFDGTTYSGYNGTTDAAGLVTFTLPFGDYRFRADKNGTQFWSGAANHCTVPGCMAATITTALHTVVTVQDSSGTPEVGLKVYAFNETIYAGYNGTTDVTGQVTFTLPFGNYRFRADKNGTQFWSGAENTCTLPGCASDTVTTTIPVLVTVVDTAGMPESGLQVYAFNGNTYTGYNKTTDAGGYVTFTLPLGNYRFRADKNGTQFWSGAENTCALPGCASDTVTTTIPVLVTVQDNVGEPEAGLPVYAFDGTTYSGYNKTTDASGWATFTLPFGDYRFRADKNGTQYWSDTENHCTLPGCTSAVITTTVQAGLLGRGKTFAAPLPWSWNVAPQPDMTAPVPLQDNSSGDLVTCTITYTYDSLNRLTAADYSTGEQYGYQYDAVGNRTAYTLTAPLDGTVVTTYTYDAANRLLVAGAPGHSVAYTWDARGNLLADGTFTYTYSAAGRMVRAESITATLVYTYNADGLRVAQFQSVASVQSVDTFTWDWATPVPELLSDGESLYLIGYDTLGWQNGDDWMFVLPDALGSVRQETDAAGAVTVAREWSPYGEEVGGAQTGLGFTGEWYDANVELTYLRARWYDGTMGRFTQQDPLRLEKNLYAYANLNPVMFVDPSGYLSSQEIAKSLGFSTFTEVKRWFLQLESKSGRLIHDDFGRWGFLALLMNAHLGDRITGLTLQIGGRKGEIDLGTLIQTNGCEYRILTPEGYIYPIRGYIEEYLEVINSRDNAGAQVPAWRTVVHRYRLNGGKSFKDSGYTDLPDWYAVSIELTLFEPAVLAGVGGGVELMGLSDRYGHDYMGLQLNLAAGANLLPFGVNYSEGHTSDLRRDWSTGLPFILDETSLRGAMIGVDIGVGFTIFGLSVSGDVGIQLPIYHTVSFGNEIAELIGIGFFGSATWPIRDNPLTDGWNKLDKIPAYDSGTFARIQ